MGYVGVSIIGIVVCIIFILLTLTFIVGFINHLIHFEIGDMLLDFLCVASFIGIFLMVFNI